MTVSYRKHFYLVFLITFMIVILMGFLGIRTYLFFYPGVQRIDDRRTDTEEFDRAVVSSSQVLVADTKFVIKEISLIDGLYREYTTEIPKQYLGMDRKDLETLLEMTNRSPGLREREKGFVLCELVSFSKEQLVIKKYYDSLLWESINE